MAKARLTEYAELARDGSVVVLAPKEPSQNKQVIEFDTTSVESAPFGDSANFLRVIVDEECYYDIGGGATAEADSANLLFPNHVFWFGVDPGDKIAFIKAGAPADGRREAPRAEDEGE